MSLTAAMLLSMLPVTACRSGDGTQRPRTPGTVRCAAFHALRHGARIARMAGEAASPQAQCSFGLLPFLLTPATKAA
ncbi:hypothetical protein ACFQY9_24150 [Microvirga aerilata]|uniref:hypothetical protein n=1 Tax=Microvirga aerilata TaxID=670292 RepID=UPI00363999FB